MPMISTSKTKQNKTISQVGFTKRFKFSFLSDIFFQPNSSCDHRVSVCVCASVSVCVGTERVSAGGVGVCANNIFKSTRRLRLRPLCLAHQQEKEELSLQTLFTISF